MDKNKNKPRNRYIDPVEYPNQAARKKDLQKQSNARRTQRGRDAALADQRRAEAEAATAQANQFSFQAVAATARALQHSGQANQRSAQAEAATARANQFSAQAEAATARALQLRAQANAATAQAHEGIANSVVTITQGLQQTNNIAWNAIQNTHRNALSTTNNTVDATRDAIAAISPQRSNPGPRQPHSPALFATLTSDHATRLPSGFASGRGASHGLQALYSPQPLARESRNPSVTGRELGASHGPRETQPAAVYAPLRSARSSPLDRGLSAPRGFGSRSSASQGIPAGLDSPLPTARPTPRGESRRRAPPPPVKKTITVNLEAPTVRRLAVATALYKECETIMINQFDSAKDCDGLGNMVHTTGVQAVNFPLADNLLQVNSTRNGETHAPRDGRPKPKYDESMLIGNFQAAQRLAHKEFYGQDVEYVVEIITPQRDADSRRISELEAGRQSDALQRQSDARRISELEAGRQSDARQRQSDARRIAELEAQLGIANYKNDFLLQELANVPLEYEEEDEEE